MSTTFRSRIAAAALVALTLTVGGVAANASVANASWSAPDQPAFGSDEWLVDTTDGVVDDADCIWWGDIQERRFAYTDSSGRKFSVRFGMAVTYADGSKIAKADRQWQFMGAVRTKAFSPLDGAWNKRPAKFTINKDMRRDYPVKADLRTRAIKP